VRMLTQRATVLAVALWLVLLAADALGSRFPALLMTYRHCGRMMCLISAVDAERGLHAVLHEATGLTLAAAAPQAERVAFVRAGTPFELLVLDIDTGRTDLLATAETEPRDISWSPDGQRVVYRLDSQVYVVDVDQQAVTLRHESRGSPYHLVWETTDTLTFFLSAEVYRADLRDDSVERLLALPVQGSLPVATWSPDGQRLAYLLHPSGPSVQLYDVATDTIQRHRVAGLVGPWDLAWRDNERLAVVGVRARRNAGILIDVRTGEETTLRVPEDYEWGLMWVR